MVNLEDLSEKLPLIEREIAVVFPKHGLPNLQDAVWYHMDTGGKKLRPLLAIATCEALGGSARQIAPFAAACEVLHNWFLVHDDIEDGDKMRRDRPAVWVKYGLAHGINVGDYMSQKVFELILNSKKYGVDNEKIFRLTEAMVKTSVKTAEGQTMDINLRNNNAPSEEDYMEMVMGKTGHYLTVTMIGAAIVADRGEIIPHLLEFGQYIGPAFQIADDVLDLTEGKGRGETGRDIKEGKRSILVVHCLQHCSAAEGEKLISILNKPPEHTTAADVDEVKKLFEKYDSIEYARRKAHELQKSALISAKKIPELYELLEFFADKLVNRRS
jgi:geranylgeranyl pyrophosphate synthase